MPPPLPLAACARCQVEMMHGCMVAACRRTTLEQSLSAMGLDPAGEPVVVPIKVR